MASELVVVSKVKDEVTKAGGKDFRLGSDAVSALTDHVKEVVKKAVQAAKDNGRSTVKGRDVEMAVVPEGERP